MDKRLDETTINVINNIIDGRLEIYKQKIKSAKKNKKQSNVDLYSSIFHELSELKNSIAQKDIDIETNVILEKYTNKAKYSIDDMIGILSMIPHNTNIEFDFGYYPTCLEDGNILVYSNIANGPAYCATPHLLKLLHNSVFDYKDSARTLYVKHNDSNTLRVIYGIKKFTDYKTVKLLTKKQEEI